MNRTRLTYLLGLLLGAVVLSSSQDVTIFSSRGPTVTVPSMSLDLMPGLPLLCGLESDTLPPDFNYTTRWRLPGREIINSTRPERFVLSENLVSIGGRSIPGTVLVVLQISYQDAGMYTCEGRSTDPGASPQWAADSFELQLNLELLSNTSAVMATMDDSTIALYCEMRAFIRPDSSLVWEEPGGRTITGETGKHQITFSDGSPDAAAIGGGVLVPSRVSKLTITNPEPSDAGTYTCSVMGTSEAVTLELQVNGSISGSTSTSTTAASVEGTAQFPLPAVIGAIAGFLGLIVVILVVVIVIVSVHRSKSTSVMLIADDIHDNSAYESTNGSAAHHRPAPPQYAQVAKASLSPPPLPARPSTNMSHNHANSVMNSVANSMTEIDKEPPGYETPDIINISSEQSNKYDPYYDNPDEAKTAIAMSKKSAASSGGPRTYYDEVDVNEREAQRVLDMTTVPSPADLLSGSLQRNATDPRNPDFNYPIYNDGFTTADFDKDYDQIYSEPLDPTMLRHEYELERDSIEAIPYSAIYEDPHPLHDNIAPLKVTYDNIIKIRKLGTGQFGHVILARTRGLSLADLRLSETDADPNANILVAIKKLKLDAESCLMEAFEKEVKFMSRLNHDNVVRLLGVCTNEESFIMMEYMENGDLNQFLQKQKLMPDTISGLQENEVTPVILLYMGVQIASGMHYLASRKFVHRDLATRNCLVGKDFIVKISDFGMSRSLYESAYYRVQGTLVLPIRWMACETFYGKFSVKSDAWAFGVALWEIYTLGKVDPYDDMTDEEVIADAIRGPDRKIPERTEVCPEDVYDIMQRCWVHEPSMRADFGEIYSRLFMIYTRQAL